jgi:CheY-like chemotaxis protein/predicted transcriptional regulator
MDKLKVLMVDDEAKFRETTAKILSRKGYLTTVAGSGEEAIEILRQAPHDVVVLDIKMPGMDGHEALAKIKEIDEKIQVIMLTGHGEYDSARESLKHGAYDYLSKPCDIDRLAARIQDAHLAGRTGQRDEKLAKNIMIPINEYSTVSPDNSIGDCITMLRDSFEGLASTSRLMTIGHRSLMVFDRGKLVGVVSIMDLIGALRPAYLSVPRPSMAYSMEYSAMFWSGLFTKQAKDLAAKKITQVMSPPPPYIDAEANLMETANLIYQEESRRLAVIDNGQVVGVVREQEVFFEITRVILGL